MKKQFLLLVLCWYSFLSIAQESYYNNVDLNLTGIDLRNALTNKITTTHINFLEYTPDTWNASMITDMNPQNSSEVLLVYGYENGTDGDSTNDRERGINDNCTTSSCNGLWNREHVYPNSLATPDLNQGGINGPPYADAHNLRPCDAQRNSSRGNKLFINGTGNSGAVGSGWYPGDEWKGDVARIIMYMYVRYGDRALPTNVGIGSSIDTPDEMIDLFLQWNADDPVSNIEKQRNPYHENINNTDAQGNRNPFIDNPRLATRIWGGPEAEDLWGIYSNIDTEAPSIPTNLVATNITTYSIDLSWDAATDNIGVSSYEVFVDGNLEVSVTNTNFSISALASNTSYQLTVLAKDLAENSSAQSTPITASTLIDSEAPSVPTNIQISNETDVSFKITWEASSDNTQVIGYDIFLDGNFNSTTSNTSITINNLTPATTYAVSVSAKDAINNSSEQSNSVDASTTDGSNSSANELIISEYVEGSSNNKAIEIANITTNSINLTNYNLRRQQNGAGDWSSPFFLEGVLSTGDVLVIINGSADDETLINEADMIVSNNASTNYGEPLNFNGNDPVGFFKNDLLIDIVGVFDGGSGNFAKDVTLRRKSSVSEPNTTFDLENEWDEYSKDTFNDVGSHSSSLNTSNVMWEELSIYPNPTSNDYIYLKIYDDVTLEVFTIFGKKLLKVDIEESDSKIDISQLASGIYFFKISNNRSSTLRKIIKQ